MNKRVSNKGKSRKTPARSLKKETKHSDEQFLKTRARQRKIGSR